MLRGSLEAVPSIWDAKRSLTEEQELAREQILTSTRIQQTRAEFGTCMTSEAGVSASDPTQAEDLIGAMVDSGAPGDPAQAIDALQTCMPIWEEGYRVAESEASEAFVARNQLELNAQRDRYDTVWMEMIIDDVFWAWLQQALVVICDVQPTITAVLPECQRTS